MDKAHEHLIEDWVKSREIHRREMLEKFLDIVIN